MVEYIYWIQNSIIYKVIAKKFLTRNSFVKLNIIAKVNEQRENSKKHCYFLIFLVQYNHKKERELTKNE